jgi:hypothetical protein
VAQLRASIEAIAAMPLESIVQGHGEIILRGEIKDNIRRSLNYLEHLYNKVHKVVESGGSLEEARKITIEQCGLQRVLLNGMVTQLHTANVVALYHRFMAEQGTARPAAVRAGVVAATEPEAGTTARKTKTATKRATKRAGKAAARRADTKRPASAAKSKSKTAAKTARKRAGAKSTSASKSARAKGTRSKGRSSKSSSSKTTTLRRSS